MTKRERAQVVKLLRCAADDAQTGAFTRAQEAIGPVSGCVYYNAVSAFDSSPFVGFDTEGYRERLLEAAARVEEGSWP